MLARSLSGYGWQTDIVGPRRYPTTWQFRLGLDYGALSRAAMSEAYACKPDLIVTCGFLGVDLRARVPRVHVYHGTLVGSTRAMTKLMSRREVVRRTVAAGATEALAGRRATQVVCVSEATAQEVRRLYRIADIEVIPNGVDETIFAPRDRQVARAELGLREDRRYALFVGRFEARKSGAIALAAAKDAGYELLVAGPTAPDGAHHLGTLPPEILTDAYAAADCVVLPSHYEACSLVILEALACGRPLISTRVGWMKTLLQAVPEYERLCVDATIEDVRTRMEELPDIDLATPVARARELVLRHNSLAPWSEHWQAVATRAIEQ